MNTAAVLRAMLDFHSHCLPAMDDGASDRDESLAMLNESSRQGVKTVVATPHYYASQESVSEFLASRTKAVERLGELPKDMRLLLGAEVLLQKGLAAVDLSPLCIEGTRNILIELPFMSPMSWMMEELENIAYAQRLDIILAHVERYMPWYSREQMEMIMDFPSLTVQMNAESLLTRSDFRRVRRWLPSTGRLVFGSDMHHVEHRRQRLQEASDFLIQRMAGRRWMLLAEQTGNEILSGKKNDLFDFMD